MPRPPATIHPVRKLRQKLEMTQPEFGELMGIPSETIKSVENGKLEVSFKLATAIAEKTGIDVLTITYLWQLREKNGDSFKHLFEQSWKAALDEERRLNGYSKEKFEKRNTRISRQSMNAEEFLDDVRPYLFAAFHVASFRRGDPQRLKRDLLLTLIRTSNAIWTETMDVLPNDLPDVK